MMLASRRSFVSLPALPRLFRRRAKPPSEAEDIELLSKFCYRVDCLKSVPYDNIKPLYDIAKDTRISSGLTFSDGAATAQQFSLLASLDDIDISLEKHLNATQNTNTGSEVSSPNSVTTIEDNTEIRVKFARNYFLRLRRSLIEEDLSSDLFSKMSMARLVDTMLLGTSSERIQTQMLLYAHDTPLNIERMQECFYALYEPEIDTCLAMLLAEGDRLHPHHRKGLQKFWRTYLLDKLDLHMHLRCTLGWADRSFSGFQPLERDFSMPVWDVIHSRREFYEEGDGVARQFADDFLGQRRAYYNGKRSDRQTMQRGALFVFVTILLDWAVCVM